MELYPIKLTYHVRNYAFGERLIPDVLGKEGVPEGVVAETWEISDYGETTGEIINTTDPGRAMITGKCADIGKVKGPILRGLAARPPYFHNGSAATLEEVVDFYNTRFQLGLTRSEKADLLAFLRAL